MSVSSMLASSSRPGWSPTQSDQWEEQDSFECVHMAQILLGASLSSYHCLERLFVLRGS